MRNSLLSSQSAAKALGKIGDARAVKPLIALLKHKNAFVRSAASRALGELRNAQAVKPLLTGLMDGSVEGAAFALERIGWQPGTDEAGAAYWVGKTNWEECIRIGAPAIKPLIASLKNKSEFVRQDAAKALERIGWQPGGDETGAVYWVVKGNWKECVKIGAPAVMPLIAGLNEWRGGFVEALGEIGDDRAVEPLLQIALHGFDNDRKEVVRALLKSTLAAW